MLALLLVLACGGASLRAVGVVDGAPLRVEVDGRAVQGQLGPTDKEPAVAINGSARGDTLQARAGEARLEAALGDEVIEGTWTSADGQARPIRLGDGLQEVVVAERRETWQREWQAKPVGVDIPVCLPWVLVADPELQDAMDALLSPEALIGQPRAEAEADGWLDAVDFEVGYAAAGVVDLRMQIDGSGAYPSTRRRSVVVFVPEARVLGAEVFSQPEALAARVDATLQERARASEAAEDPEVAAQMAERRFTAASLGGFSLSEQGVIFHHAWGFPHAVQAMAPDGDVLVPWVELEAHLGEGSPLAAAAKRQK